MRFYAECECTVSLALYPIHSLQKLPFFSLHGVMFGKDPLGELIVSCRDCTGAPSPLNNWLLVCREKIWSFFGKKGCETLVWYVRKELLVWDDGMCARLYVWMWAYAPSDKRSEFGGAVSRVIGQAGEMSWPDPADLLGGVVLVPCEPELPFLTNDIENLYFPYVSISVSAN